MNLRKLNSHMVFEEEGVPATPPVGDATVLGTDTATIAVPKWAEGNIPGDVLSDPAFREYVKDKDDIGAFAKASMDSHGRVGELEKKLEGALFTPGEGATEEEISAYRTGMGVPDAPDGYELSAYELPEGMAIDENLVSWFKGAAHELGMPANMADQFYRAYNDSKVAEFQAHQEATIQQKAESVAALKKEYGDKWDGALEKAQRTAGKVLGEKGKELLNVQLADGSALGNHPEFVAMFLSLSEVVGEDSFTPGAAGGEPGLQLNQTTGTPLIFQKQ